MHTSWHQLVLATSNAGKIRELAESLASLGVDVLGLADFPHIGTIAEDGSTFEENARIKAHTVAAATGLPTVADDSGLEVAALHGAPGVHSARYADDWPPQPGENRDQRNMRKLLQTLKDVPDAERGCRFVCCMALVQPDGQEWLLRGTWDGRLLHAPQGSNGFGYDPIFWVPQLNKSAAQLTREEKNARSHRGQALRALLELWKNRTR